jgi:hypothetical protein
MANSNLREAGPIMANRFSDLVHQGESIFERLKGLHNVDTQDRPECVAWLMSVVNLLEKVMPIGNRYQREGVRLLPSADGPIYLSNFAAMLGVLRSASDEWDAGLIHSFELQFIGLAFEDFLRHAATYTEAGRTIEAAVLASAVFEDSIKRLCDKHGIQTTDKTLESLVNALKTNRILGKVKAGRLRSYVSIRNGAFHADWKGFDQRDLRQMIEGLEELIEDHLN